MYSRDVLVPGASTVPGCSQRSRTRNHKTPLNAQPCSQPAEAGQQGWSYRWWKTPETLETSPQPCFWDVLMSARGLSGCSLENCPQPKLLHPQRPQVHSVRMVGKEKDRQLLQTRLNALVSGWRAAQPHSPARSTFRQSGEAQGSRREQLSSVSQSLVLALEVQVPGATSIPFHSHTTPAASQLRGEGWGGNA